MSLISDLRHAFPPPHRAGHPFVAGGVAVMVLGLIFTHWLIWPGLAFTLFCLFFFRNPQRVPPNRAEAVVAPADGRVVSVDQAIPPRELGLGDDKRWRVSIFLSVLNVHANRIPVDGTVMRIAYRHGAFVNASLEKASEDNERNAMTIRMADGREVVVVQIAGLIARRILCFVFEGEPVRTGALYGFIRFGSRTDLYLPPGVIPLVVEGQTMIGGETVIATLSP